MNSAYRVIDCGVNLSKRDNCSFAGACHLPDERTQSHNANLSNSTNSRCGPGPLRNLPRTAHR
jgi:hypothetical protein